MTFRQWWKVLRSWDTIGQCIEPPNPMAGSDSPCVLYILCAFVTYIKTLCHVMLWMDQNEPYGLAYYYAAPPFWECSTKQYCERSEQIFFCTPLVTFWGYRSTLIANEVIKNLSRRQFGGNPCPFLATRLVHIVASSVRGFAEVYALLNALWLLLLNALYVVV